MHSFRHMSLFKKYLISFTSSMAIITFIISSILYTQYSRSFMTVLQTQNQKVLSQMSYSTTYMNTLANYVTNTLFLNSSIRSCLYSDPLNPIVRTSAVSTMDSLQITDYIHSIYLYNGSMDMYISNVAGSTLRSDAFYDEEVVRLMKAFYETGQVPTAPIPRYLHKGHEKTPVYTYFLIDKQGDYIESAIIVNVATKWFNNLITSLDHTFDGTEVMVMDNEGKIINQGYNEPFLWDLSSSDLYANIHNSNRTYDTFESMDYVVSYTKVEPQGWYFISRTPKTYLYQRLETLKTYTLLIIGALLIFAFGVAWLYSKRLYKPISYLKESMMASQHTHKKKTPTNELDFIQQAFKETLEKTKSLQNKEANGRLLMKNTFLVQLLKGIKQPLIPDLLRLNIKEPLFLMLIHIDDYDAYQRNFDVADQNLYRFAICNIASEIASKTTVSDAMDLGDGNIGLLFNILEPTSEDDLYKILGDVALHIQGAIQEFLELSTSYTLGYTVTDLNHLPALYKDSKDIARYGFVHGKGCILTPSDLDAIEDSYYSIPKNLETTLLQAIKMGQKQHAVDTYKAIIEDIKSLSMENIYAALTYLLHSLYHTVTLIGKEHEHLIHPLFNGPLKDLMTLETLDQVNSEFEMLIANIIGVLEEMNRGTSRDVIGDMLHIIHEEYQDKNLCLNELASRLHLSPVYLGRLFKKSRQQSVANYITTYRMNKVKYYLDHTSLSIKEILEKVGIEKSNYFYTTFKKHFGLSLTAYKQQMRDE